MSNPENYLVCASQRSGSTLLVESLSATGVAGRPEEFFQYLQSSSLAPQPREWFAGVTDSSILELLDDAEPGEADTREFAQWRADVRAAGATPNGVWGGKLMWNQTPLLVARTRVASGRLRTAVRQLLGADPLFIHVHREDVVPQAVSMWRAVQTRVWRDGHGPHFDADRDAGAQYHAEAIAHLAGLLVDQERQWRRWFDEERIEPIEIEFGKLVSDPQGATAAVLSALNLDPGLAPPPPLKPQSNARSRDWVRRYRLDAETYGYPL
ncbi:trehalose 2-sulfotransferase [Gordonia sp. DT30]|uniref:trehalose 2-sulfotransferase n=1 Tax=Gordonia sp. DT30 TaxID=3416546 RepID=UPI003CEE1DD7